MKQCVQRYIVLPMPAYDTQYWHGVVTLSSSIRDTRHQEDKLTVLIEALAAEEHYDHAHPVVRRQRKGYQRLFHPNQVAGKLSVLLSS